jgi:hypothetical protein
MNLSAFIPFSFGPANCAGKNLAMLEMRTVIALLIRRFDMAFSERFTEGYSADKWGEDAEDWVVFKNGPLPVVLTSRR